MGVFQVVVHIIDFTDSFCVFIQVCISGVIIDGISNILIFLSTGR